MQEWSEWFSSDVMETPLRDIPETKQSFLPSIWEKKKVSLLRYVMSSSLLGKQMPSHRHRCGQASQFCSGIWIFASKFHNRP